MIQIWKTQENRLMPVAEAGASTWMDVRNVTREELNYLENEYKILPDHLQDIMDTDEQSRIEKEDEYTMLVIRLPVLDTRHEVAFFTVPFGIILFGDRIITICQADSDVLSDLVANRVKGFSIRNKSAFILNLFGRAATVYLRHLKDINRRTNVIERELQRSIKNNELTQLLSIQKSLVFFTTSLKQNEILLEKLQNSKIMRFKEDESDLLEDVVTDNKQAIEMANIYSSILTGMMDAFASVISNNLNIVMKRLTTISIVLMIPTMLASLFSMNVGLPFLSGKTWSFWVIIGLCAATSLVGAYFLRDRKQKRLP